MAAKHAKPAGHLRSGSLLVPAVPKIFDKQSSKPVHASDIHSTNGSTAKEVALETGTGAVSGSSNTKDDEHDTIAKDIAAEKSDDALSQRREEGATPKSSEAVTETRSSPVTHPAAFPPEQLHQVPAVSFPARDEIRRSDASAGQSTPTTENLTFIRERRSNPIRRIAFGSFGNPSESSESSPTPPPSATLTHQTQPTPASETRSQASGSDGDILHPERPHDKTPQPVSKAEPNERLVGPYPHGLIGGHVMDFVKYQRQSLTQYLQDLFMRNDGDVLLEVRFKSRSINYNLHSVILCQSPMLAKAIQRGFETRALSPEGKIHVLIGVQDVFASVTSIETVLKSMYGFSDLDVKALTEPYLDFRFFASIFASSCLLAVPGYQIFASNCIVEMLNWKTLSDAFDLCLTEEQYPATRDPYPRRTDDIVTRLFQPQAGFVFERALSILVQNLNSDDFSFDANAKAFVKLGGMPPVEKSVEVPAPASKNKPGITFGNLGNGGSAKNQVLSGLLLSLPVLVLQRVLAELNANIGAQIMESAIHERQRRRDVWSATPGREELALVKEICIPVEFLPNGIGVINEMS